MLLGGGAACGDSNSPVMPGSVVIADGDGQELPTGTSLPVPLKVTVLGSGSQAYAGATVTWAVTAGSATLGGTTSTSDAAGAATMTVTLGGTIGAVSIRASVPGVTPVTFSATALDPCTYLWGHTFGTTVNGTLATTDCNFNGYFTDFYGVALGAQQGLTITMSSGTLATWMDVFRFSGGDYLAFEGDTVVSTSTVLNAIVAPGSYILAPNTYFQLKTGPYTLSTAARPQEVSACALVWVTRGVTVTDSVTAADCSDTDATGTYYSDGVAMIAQSGSVLTIAQRSTVFDAFLTVLRYDAAGDSVILVAANDDSAGVGPNSQVVFTVPVAAVYFVFAGTSGASATGAYSLAISSSTTASAATAAPGVGGSGSLRFVPQLRMPKVRGWGRSPLPRGARFR
jgi:hypothetical protein